MPKKKKEPDPKVLESFMDAIAGAMVDWQPGPLDEGLRFEVSEDGQISILFSDKEELAQELIHVANTHQLRGALMALKMREMLQAQGVWNRFVVAHFSVGAHPLKPTTPEQKASILSVFSKGPRDHATA